MSIRLDKALECIEEKFKDLSYGEQLDILNEYNEENFYDRIYELTEEDVADALENYDVIDVVRILHRSDIDWSDDFFTFDGYEINTIYELTDEVGNEFYEWIEQRGKRKIDVSEEMEIAFWEWLDEEEEDKEWIAKLKVVASEMYLDYQDSEWEDILEEIKEEWNSRNPNCVEVLKQALGFVADSCGIVRINVHKDMVHFLIGEVHYEFSLADYVDAVETLEGNR